MPRLEILDLKRCGTASGMPRHLLPFPSKTAVGPLVIRSLFCFLRFYDLLLDFRGESAELFEERFGSVTLSARSCIAERQGARSKALILAPAASRPFPRPGDLRRFTAFRTSRACIPSTAQAPVARTARGRTPTSPTVFVSSTLRRALRHEPGASAFSCACRNAACFFCPPAPLPMEQRHPLLRHIKRRRYCRRGILINRISAMLSAAAAFFPHTNRRSR
jgi:hypothetical protein